MGFLDFISPELSKLMDMYHDTAFHKGESVWDHTLYVLNRTPPTMKARLSALFHDVGKLETQSFKGDRIHFYKHENVSARIVDKILRELKAPNELRESVRDIVHAHMGFRQKDQGESAIFRRIRILIEKLYGDLDDALSLMRADTLNEKEEKGIDDLKKRIEEQKKKDEENGLLVEKGGKLRYESPIKGDMIPALKNEFQIDDRTLGAVLNKLKEMTLEGHFDDPDKKKRVQKAQVMINMFMKDKNQLKALLKNFEEVKESPEFFKVRC
jgi:tRNA nucleotidyltransferase (CCA-adding enzyme)